MNVKCSILNKVTTAFSKENVGEGENLPDVYNLTKSEVGHKIKEFRMLQTKRLV